MKNFKFANQLMSTIKLNISTSHIFCDIQFSNKLWKLLKYIKLAGFLSDYIKFFINGKFLIRIFFNYSDLTPPNTLFSKIHLVSSHKIFLSVNKIKKINRSLGNVLMIFSTHRGYKTNYECIKENIGGLIILVFYR